jgi:hypothetical protein
MVNLEGYLWFLYTYSGIHRKIAFFPQKMYTVNKNGPKYPDEVEGTKVDADLITWPWEIDHMFLSKNGMFCGNLKSL